MLRLPRWRAFALVVGVTLASQVMLHFVYGEETFLYAAHFLPLLMAVAVFARHSELGGAAPVIAMFWRLRQRPTLIDMSLVMLSLTIASPVAWEHHCGVLFPVFAVMLPAALQVRPFGRWTLPLFWIGFTLTSQSFVTLTNLLAGTRLNVLQSYIFFGGLLVLAMLYRMSRLEASTGAATREGVPARVTVRR